MYRRLFIISLLVFGSLCGLGWLGYRSIEMQAEGLEGRRVKEFAEVAEQIRRDVKRKLDAFIGAEQQRPYEHYQYYYVPEEVDQGAGQQVTLLRSPVGEQLDYGLAYGYFQIESDGSLSNPFTRPGQAWDSDAEGYFHEVQERLLPKLAPRMAGTRLVRREVGPPKADPQKDDESVLPATPKATDEAENRVLFERGEENESGKASGKLSKKTGRAEYKIASLDNEAQPAPVVRQSRSRQNVELNIANLQVAQMPGQGELQEESLGISQNTTRQELVSTVQVQELPPSSEASGRDDALDSTVRTQEERVARLQKEMPSHPVGRAAGEEMSQGEPAKADDAQANQRASDLTESNGPEAPAGASAWGQAATSQETVQVRIEPFVPVVVASDRTEDVLFGGLVYLLRHVQIEQRHFLQGFQLNSRQLAQEIRESASRLMRQGMEFRLDKGELAQAAYPAYLDFGFGEVVLNLVENDPGWIDRQMGLWRRWYFGIMAVVLAVTGVGLASLWRCAGAQIKLHQQKDDFISAVSHELRTPLTSIRMYTEMLEKGWVKTAEKRVQYLHSMGQESERLSRLIENVLDFSRISRGRKKYCFQAGCIDECLKSVVAMMAPYAQQYGFEIETYYAASEPVIFDKDAVMQIVINLVDNAVKYAREATDKRIMVRTYHEDEQVMIEVEDRGPGVPYRQREKIFEDFYRVQEENRREAAGTGLGLALVKKFAEAHQGFVEVQAAQPTGALFRVGLALQN